MATAPDQPTLSRRHAAGAESARGLLFTVLGEFVLPNGGSAWTSAVIDVLARLNIEEKAARQALMRTAADGWLGAERVGRRTRWWLTDAASRMLTDGTARIYGFTGVVPDWDGRWLLVLVRVPETERPTRHQLRTRLAWAGMGTPSPGVWVSTHTDRLPEVRQVLIDAGVVEEAQIFLARYADGGELGRMVRLAWDVSGIGSQYEQFLDEFQLPAGDDRLTRLVELVHAWRRFLLTDPALPRELLPTPWSGESAAALFARRHDEWTADARTQWRQLNA